MKKVVFLIIFVLFLLTLYFYEKNIDFFDFDNDKQIEISLKIDDNLLNELDEIENVIEILEIKIDWEVVKKEDINNKIKEDSVVVISWTEKKEKKEIDNIEKEVSIINYENIDNISIEKLNYSSNISNIIKIKWKNLDQIEFVIIWEMSFKPEYNSDYLYVLVEKNDALNWEQIVFFQRLNWKIETYPEKLKFTYTDSNIVVVNITPRIIKNDINRNIVLQWKWYSKVISIWLSNNIILKDTSFNVITDAVMSVVIPKGLENWKYKLNIMDVEWIYKTDIDIEIN